jgi:hypothetical protein
LNSSHGVLGKSIATLTYLVTAEKLLIASGLFTGKNVSTLPLSTYLNLIEQDTVDYTDRAFEVVCDYVSTRRNNITSSNYGGENYGLQLGYIMNNGRVCVYKTELKDYLARHGFDDFKLIMKNFARRNYISCDKNGSGHFERCIKINGKVQRMIMLILPEIYSEEEY